MLHLRFLWLKSDLCQQSAQLILESLLDLFALDLQLTDDLRPFIVLIDQLKGYAYVKKRMDRCIDYVARDDVVDKLNPTADSIASRPIELFKDI